MELFFSELILVVIAILSILIAYEFYNSKDGQLRVLIIRLFIAKVWVYGGAAVYYFWEYEKLVSISPLMLRLVLNTPMFIVMLQLWNYIRARKID